MATEPQVTSKQPPRVRLAGPEAVEPDPAAARLFGAALCRTTGLLPLGWEGSYLKVATAWPMSEAGARFAARLGAAVTLVVADEEELAAARRRVFGSAVPARPRRFGEWALALGRVDEAGLAEALARQAREGGRLGEVLMASGLLTAGDVAEVLGAQSGLPVRNLLKGPWASPAWWDVMPQAFWAGRRMVPVGLKDGRLEVAMEDPAQKAALAEIEAALGRPVTAAVTGHRDVNAALEARYGADDLRYSRDALSEARPGDSARQVWSRRQLGALAGLGLLLAAGMVWRAGLVLAVANSLLIVLYAVAVGSRFLLLKRAAGGTLEQRVTAEELAALDPRTLPVYTVLIPARDEAGMLPTLVEALEDLDYPKDRLDVKLLLEGDDGPTLKAAREGRLPAYMEIVVVPPGEPRTKPKACNYGLARARGEFVTIYDAEDIPEPSQLKKALAVFRREGERLACLQAKLTYFNRDQNLLTRWFTVEYAAWFDLFLPALHAGGHPVPLGGTSNHFRVDLLRKVGAWDPYNVTEDADLGIRLAKAGYRTAVLDAVTYEEANSEFLNWVRQRSRWVKGYLQTWLVHMREPRRLWRALGPRGFWGFQVAILGTPLMFLLNPLYWALTTFWFLSHWHVIPHLFPPGIYYLGMANLLAGNFLFTYWNAMAAATRGEWGLVKWSLLSPVYWAMMSLAAWKAALQLLTRPSHWEKTRHGLVAGPVPPLWDHPAEAGAGSAMPASAVDR